jgi:Ni/Fe-hydrogenase subunit HybB-like protein
MQRGALAAGLFGAVAVVVGSFVNLEQLFRSYLMAYLFWIGLSLGCLAVLMLHRLTGGPWGYPIRRPLAAGAGTLPLMAVLFLPLIFGLSHLYPWTGTNAGDELLQHKSAYLNVPFFLIRTAVYFVIWIGLTWLLSRWARQQDQAAGVTAARQPARRAQRLSGPGLILFALTVTFAAIDWAMSLEPEWISTVYGMLFIAAQALGGLALAIAVLGLLHHREPLSRILSSQVFNDLGNLLLTFVLTWAYLAFIQFMVIWSGNLPEEVPWYLARTQGGWLWVAILLVLFQFAVPFVLLLSREVKRQARLLSAVAALLVCLRLVDTFWLVTPAFFPGNFHAHWLDLATVVGLGGAWTAVFVWQLSGNPLLPRNEPALQEATADARPEAVGHQKRGAVRR